MLTYRHAGDVGDCIWFLPVIRHHGTGALFIEAAPYTRQKLTPDKWACMTKLLKAQPYIADVREWAGQTTDYCGNDFRAHMVKALRGGNAAAKTTSLCDWMMSAHSVPLSESDRPWLTVEPKREAQVVINRSPRYHNHLFDWKRIVDAYKGKCIFIGLPEEHATFCNLFGLIPYRPTVDLYEAGQLIAGADLYIGNQSACYAISIGLGQNSMLEVWHNGPNCLFCRPNVFNCWDGCFDLPDLP